MDDLQRLAADLAAAGTDVQKKASAAVRKTALDIEATAKAVVPVDTGNLRNSIGASPPGQTRPLQPGDMTAEIGPTASYGVYVEFGTRNMAPQPYMRPAFDRHADELEQAFGQIGGEIL